jgi:ankyrin repeat protein
MIRLLLQAGADLETPDDIGWRPLHLASSRGNKNAVRALLEAGASTGATTKTDSTILHCACLCSHSANRQAVVSLLLEAGCDINALTSFGYTPLHYACKKNYSNCARLLVSAGCSTTLHNNGGETALETAEHNGHEELVQELRPLIKAANKKRRKNAQKARRQQQQQAAAAAATATAVAAAADASAEPEPELEPEVEVMSLL